MNAPNAVTILALLAAATAATACWTTKPCPTTYTAGNEDGGCPIGAQGDCTEDPYTQCPQGTGCKYVLTGGQRACADGVTFVPKDIYRYGSLGSGGCCTGGTLVGVSTTQGCNVPFAVLAGGLCRFLLV